MTIKEAQAKYGCKEYIPSIGQTLTSIADILYGSRDAAVLYCLTNLNSRFDWNYIESDTVILYFDFNVCMEINEVVS